MTIQYDSSLTLFAELMSTLSPPQLIAATVAEPMPIADEPIERQLSSTMPSTTTNMA